MKMAAEIFKCEKLASFGPFLVIFRNLKPFFFDLTAY